MADFPLVLGTSHFHFSWSVQSRPFLTQIPDFSLIWGTSVDYLKNPGRCFVGCQACASNTLLTLG
jgi:hypothetical protein